VEISGTPRILYGAVRLAYAAAVKADAIADLLVAAIDTFRANGDEGLATQLETAAPLVGAYVGHVEENQRRNRSCFIADLASRMLGGSCGGRVGLGRRPRPESAARRQAGGATGRRSRACVIRCDAAIHFTLRVVGEGQTLHSWRQCKRRAVVSLVHRRAALCRQHFQRFTTPARYSEKKM